MKITEILNTKNPDRILSEIIHRIHHAGPTNHEDLETLTYMKEFYPRAFSKVQGRLMFLLGLFYKTNDPQDLLSLAYSIFENAIREETEQIYTPVQASIRNGILQNRYFSFSAPTSAGKSFLLRELVKEEEGDIIIVVPSRALIAEYMLKIKEIIGNRKDILVLQFVDDINKSKTRRRIFVVTPERAVEVFKYQKAFNISLFLYDEAQISEEEGRRGVEFDALVRRVERTFHDAKKVFAHPFILNPEAQFTKHRIKSASGYHAYDQHVVGKMYFYYNTRSCAFERFSPYVKNAHLQKNRVPINSDIVSDVIRRDGRILVYVFKRSLYRRSFVESFRKYIDQCEPIAAPEAKAIIKKIQELIGAEDGASQMIELMKRGVVIHHGSIPLNIRFLIEKFTTQGYAKICFATSTLIQGINMPFDLVWVDNFRFLGSSEDKVLGLKNLIGRAGRTTNMVNHFDHGYVVIKNIATFTNMMNESSRLSETSKLDDDVSAIPTDLEEFIVAIRNETINDEYKLPETKIERLRSETAKNLVCTALNRIFSAGKVISGDKYRMLSEGERREIKSAFHGLFEFSINRKLLTGEKPVLSRAISILLWQVQGKSFREILGLRRSYLTNRDAQRELTRSYNNKEITLKQFKDEFGKIEVRYSPHPIQLPNSRATRALPSGFGRELSEFNYDLLVYDTYDYLDKVISFSLSDAYAAAFGEYYKETKDKRALSMVNYFKYGTSDEKEIWLLRYGFAMEDIQKIKEYVVSIDEGGIAFNQEVETLQDDFIKDTVNRYK